MVVSTGTRRRQTRPTPGPSRGSRVVDFLQRRAAFLIFLIATVGLGFIAWRAIAAVVSYQPESLTLGVEDIVDGRYLGVLVRDRTRNHVLQNTFLRAAIHDGFRTAHVLRRHQIWEFRLIDTWHTESNEPAVTLIIVPTPNDQPNPPFDPVTIRLWTPPPDVPYDAEKLAAAQLQSPPRSEDLVLVRQVVSGGRYTDFDGLLLAVRGVFVFVIAGLAIIVAGAAYLCRAFMAVRWDTLTDARKYDEDLRTMQAARHEREAQKQLDLGS